MQWLMIVRPVRGAMLSEGPTPAEADAVARHFAYWQALAGAGAALVVGRTQNADSSTFGLAIFRAEHAVGAQRVADQDPAVEAGVFRAEVYPYRVAILGEAGPFRPSTMPRAKLAP